MKDWEYEVKRIDERHVLLGQNLDNRFNQVNEFRGALSDLTVTMATRRDLDSFKEQYSAAHESLRQELVSMGRRMDVSEGKAAGITTIGRVGVTALSTILVAIGIYTAVQATTNNIHSPTVVTTTVGR